MEPITRLYLSWILALYGTLAIVGIPVPISRLKNGILIKGNLSEFVVLLLLIFDNFSISQYQMTVVHTNGIFTHQVSWCCCPGADSKGWHFELLKERLFPARITKPKTAFSFQVLDHFLIDALECKTSAMSFYQKLKRITSNAFPEQLPVSCHFILDHLFE